MENRFLVAGQPLHAAVVPVPIALVAWTVVADLVFLGSGESTWYDVAFVSGLGAFVTGLLAWALVAPDELAIASRTDARGSVTVHLLVSAAGLAMFGLGAMLMLDRAAIADFAPVAAMHLLAGSGLAVSRWLGGELGSRLRVTPIRSTGVRRRVTAGTRNRRPAPAPRHGRLAALGRARRRPA